MAMLHTTAICIGVILQLFVAAEAQTTAAPAPEKPESTPLLRIEESSSFVSGDGSTFGPSCTSSYAAAFNSKTQSMVFEVDRRMDTLCPGRPADVRVVSTAAALTTDQNQGGLQADFFMYTDSDMTFSWTWACGQNVSLWLKDQFNWGYPVLPQQSGCPAVVFPSYTFNATQHWFCDNTKNSKAANEGGMRVETIPVPYHVHTMDALFHTHDDSSLSMECNTRYNNQWQAKVALMFDRVNEEIAEGDLCSSTQGIVAASMGTEFATSSNLGQLGFNIDMQGQPFDNLNDVYTCTKEVIGFLTPFSTWGEPLLNGEPGCPFLFFDVTAFTPQEEEWACPLNM